MVKGMLFSAGSMSQALLEAASHFGLSPEELAYRRVDRRHGGLRGGARVVLEVDPEAPRRVEPVSPAEEPREPSGSRPTEVTAAKVPPADAEHEVAGPSRPARAVSDDERESGAYQAVQDLLELAQVRLDARVSWGDEGLDVDLFGPDEELAWRRHGELLRSLEQLLPRMLRTEGAAPACRVDCRGFWERREEELRGIALDAVEALRREGQGQLLPPLNPSERRLVHLALREVPGVSTESEGSGFLKRIRVEACDE